MHQSMGLLTRSMFVSLFAFAVPVVACVDPQQDYNDYANRTADAHAPPVIGLDSGGETGPLYAPDAGFSSSTFYMSCLTGQAEGDPSKASQFVATMTYVPSSGGGGTVTLFKNQVLKINPSTLNDLAPLGMPYQAGPMNAQVKPDGTVTMTFGMTTIPASANPVNGMDLVFSSTTLDFHIESETQICANITGNLTMPTPTVVQGPCIYRLMPSLSAPLPQLQLSDFHCP